MENVSLLAQMVTTNITLPVVRSALSLALNAALPVTAHLAFLATQQILMGTAFS